MGVIRLRDIFYSLGPVELKHSASKFIISFPVDQLSWICWAMLGKNKCFDFYRSLRWALEGDGGINEHNNYSLAFWWRLCFFCGCLECSDFFSFFFGMTATWGYSSSSLGDDRGAGNSSLMMARTQIKGSFMVQSLILLVLIWLYSTGRGKAFARNFFLLSAVLQIFRAALPGIYPFD